VRDDRRNYVLVGAFVVAMVAALILWIALLSGRTGATDSYYVVFRNVTGLKEGVEILFQGYRVGLIEGIQRLEDGGGARFRVDVSVRRGWPIPEDSRAAVAKGLFSAAVIDISAGESERLLEPGSEIPSLEGGDPFAAVQSVATRTARLIDERFDPILAEVSEALPQIVENVERATREMNVTVGRLNELLEPQNVDRVGSILENMEKASADANALLAEVGGTRRNIDAVIAKMDGLLEEEEGDLSVAIADLRYSLAALARHVDSISTNLENTTRNMNEFSRQVRENPGVLVRGREAGDGR
jgi:phospholipid/cholesterol/gamma-HCH transport system substrate-binding protein